MGWWAAQTNRVWASARAWPSSSLIPHFKPTFGSLTSCRVLSGGRQRQITHYHYSEVHSGLSKGQINLFENYLYSIEPCTEKKAFWETTTQCKYECTINIIPFRHKITLDGLTCHYNQSIRFMHWELYYFYWIWPCTKTNVDFLEFSVKVVLSNCRIFNLKNCIHV